MNVEQTSRSGDSESVEIWFVDFDDVDDALPARYGELLDAEERARRARFVFDRDRRAYAVSHALVRWMLSHHRPDVAPGAWTFVSNAYGRPDIAPLHGCDLRFNLSHTRGGALCGVVRGREIGVDLEAVDRQSSCVELADRYFAAEEVADLMQHPIDRRRDAFFDYWTLKEAYIKARGMGLAIPLDRFAFRLRAGEPITVACAADLDADADAWQFARWNIGERFRAALAVRRTDERPLRIRVRRVVPLVRIDDAVDLDV